MRYFVAFRYLLLSLSLVVSTGQAKTYISAVSTDKVQQTLQVNVKSHIELPEAVREAIHNGITLVFSYQFEIKKQRWYPTKSLATIRKNYHLSYSRMTEKYQIENPITFERETFNRLSSAVVAMQQLNDFPLILTSQLPKTPLTLAVRFRLTAENLPSYVRLERLFSDAWEADSKWSNWPIQLSEP
ncbi:MAG: hypothetical protein CSA44_00215 [Gammaproteobacteria bacterium]|nr:MAG: hypothetical protein CSA44_00215 [Gammaproteobacteria bacterium]